MLLNKRKASEIDTKPQQDSTGVVAIQCRVLDTSYANKAQKTTSICTQQDDSIPQLPSLPSLFSQVGTDSFIPPHQPSNSFLQSKPSEVPPSPATKSSWDFSGLLLPLAKSLQAYPSAVSPATQMRDDLTRKLPLPGQHNNTFDTLAFPSKHYIAAPSTSSTKSVSPLHFYEEKMTDNKYASNYKYNNFHPHHQQYNNVLHHPAKEAPSVATVPSISVQHAPASSMNCTMPHVINHHKFTNNILPASTGTPSPLTSPLPSPAHSPSPSPTPSMPVSMPTPTPMPMHVSPAPSPAPSPPSPPSLSSAHRPKLPLSPHNPFATSPYALSMPTPSLSITTPPSSTTASPISSPTASPSRLPGIKSGRFALAEQPLPVQRKSYNHENRCLQPKPFVLMEVGEHHSQIESGTVTVEMVSVDAQPLPFEKASTLKSLDGHLTHPLDSERKTLFYLKVIDTSDGNVRLMFTITCRMRDGSSYNEILISDPFTVHSNTNRLIINQKPKNEARQQTAPN